MNVYSIDFPVWIFNLLDSRLVYFFVSWPFEELLEMECTVVWIGVDSMRSNSLIGLLSETIGAE